MNEMIETFSFDNERIKGAPEKYKGKKGETHRNGIIYTDPNAMFAGSQTHFKERFFLCKKGKCCEVLGPSKWRVGSVIVKYLTDKLGNLKKPFSYELFPWIFSEQTYLKLRVVNSEFPLASHDIKVSCSNDDYQHLDINACKESIWTSKESMKNRIIEEARPLWDFVKKSIASNLTVEEINDLIGIANPAAADPSQQLNLDDVLDQV